MVDVENFDDLLRDIAADGGPIATKLLENQQLGFKLAEENRTLRHLLQDERQAKRLLSVSNANLESQLRKAEQRAHTLEQSLRIAENRRIEIVDKYENERQQRVNLTEERVQWQTALKSQRDVTLHHIKDLDFAALQLQQTKQDHAKLVDYSHALELALNEVVAEQKWLKVQLDDEKQRSLTLETSHNQLDRRLRVLLRAWQDVLGSSKEIDSTADVVRCAQRLLSQTQHRFEESEKRQRRSQRHVQQLLRVVKDYEADFELLEDSDALKPTSSSTARSHRNSPRKRRSRSNRDRDSSTGSEGSAFDDYNSESSDGTDEYSDQDNVEVRHRNSISPRNQLPQRDLNSQYTDKNSSIPKRHRKSPDNDNIRKEYKHRLSLAESPRKREVDVEVSIEQSPLRHRRGKQDRRSEKFEN